MSRKIKVFFICSDVVKEKLIMKETKDYKDSANRIHGTKIVARTEISEHELSKQFVVRLII